METAHRITQLTDTALEHVHKLIAITTTITVTMSEESLKTNVEVITMESIKFLSILIAARRDGDLLQVHLEKEHLYLDTIEKLRSLVVLQKENINTLKKTPEIDSRGINTDVIQFEDISLINKLQDDILSLQKNEHVLAGKVGHLEKENEHLSEIVKRASSLMQAKQNQVESMELRYSRLLQKERKAREMLIAVENELHLQISSHDSGQQQQRHYQSKKSYIPSTDNSIHLRNKKKAHEEDSIIDAEDFGYTVANRTRHLKADDFGGETATSSDTRKAILLDFVHPATINDVNVADSIPLDNVYDSVAGTVPPQKQSDICLETEEISRNIDINTSGTDSYNLDGVHNDGLRHVQLQQLMDVAHVEIDDDEDEFRDERKEMDESTLMQSAEVDPWSSRQSLESQESLSALMSQSEDSFTLIQRYYRE